MNFIREHDYRHDLLGEAIKAGTPFGECFVKKKIFCTFSLLTNSLFSHSLAFSNLFYNKKKNEI